MRMRYLRRSFRYSKCHAKTANSLYGEKPKLLFNNGANKGAEIKIRNSFKISVNEEEEDV